ncbi:hypothetical protein Y032_0010g1193 [Ancylostoma ceylanicum]|uniref:Reverse transcriptase domain-containing protein n=1 Tax=Ancylostoma ceylanicum TaxID=53326 RepID=A0A016VGH2_9BILA|nr:hypothetical protein Y032_0010g1193 [Ancylostoma ceylanicum]
MSALLSTVPIWQKEVNRGNFVSVVYVDYRKAFDSISIPLLLKKMQALGIVGRLHSFLHSFLTHRTQSVIVNDAKSRPYESTSGVPQGTCLGPLMFLIYINDLPKALPSGAFCSIYADDCKIYTINDVSTLQAALNALEQWSQYWDLSISMEKTFVMGFGKNHPQVTFTINGAPLTKAHAIRDLGLTYTDTFDFGNYISDMVTKAKCRSNFILKAFKTRDPLILFKLFTTYVRPLLEYCSAIWSPGKSSQVDELESVQKSFTYRCFVRRGLFKITYDSRLSRLGALSLKDRRLIADLTIMYKLTTDELHLSIWDLFQVSTLVNKTRGHPFKIHIDRSNSRTYENSFLCRNQSLWNSLDPKLFRYRKSSTFQLHLIKHLQSRNHIVCAS